jgi:hypothetical protein
MSSSVAFSNSVPLIAVLVALVYVLGVVRWRTDERRQDVDTVLQTRRFLAKEQS